TLTPEILLRPLRPEHRVRVREIVRETGAFRASEVDVALEVFDDAFRPGQADYYLVGAFDSGETLLGYACYGPTPGAVDTWDLYWIAVHPEAQGAGVGRALWSAVERELRRREARLCLIETSSRSDYEATRRFYAACGMTAVARVPDFYDDGDDRVIYAKRLRAEGGRG
ncbi:MAG: GNAT family N-acetyltransferase, partial [Gemmatimonadota bacterium]